MFLDAHSKNVVSFCTLIFFIKNKYLEIVYLRFPWHRVYRQLTSAKNDGFVSSYPIRLSLVMVVD